MNKLFRLASFSALIVSGHVTAGECLHYDLPMVEIAGRVTRVPLPTADPRGNELGERGYAWYFESTKPLCIAAGPQSLGNRPFQDVRRFEILPPATGRGLRSFLGANVLLKGRFVPTQLPHYHHLTFSVESARLGHAP